MSGPRTRRGALEALQAEVAELRRGDDTEALEAGRAELEHRRAEALARVTALEQVLAVERGRLREALETARFRAALRPEPPRDRRGRSQADWKVALALALAAAGYVVGRIAADVSPTLPWLLAAAAAGVAGFLGAQAGRAQRARAQAERTPLVP